jgi:hypothetical protein
VLRRIFGPKRGKINRGVEKNCIMRWLMNCTPHQIYMGDQIKKNKKPEGKRPAGRSRHKWEDNMKTDLQEVERGGMDWIDVAQNRVRWWALVKIVMNLQVLSNVGNFFTSEELMSFSIMTLFHAASE